jgi:iron(III) transport system substrate-binding protein
MVVLSSEERMSKEPGKKSDSNWPHDRFGIDEAFSWLWWVPIVLIILLGTLLLPTLNIFRKGPRLVVYCAQDQVYAEQIFKKFKDKTGIRVLAVYDSEAVKTVGLANRLLAEKAQPRADLFWGNEELRARQLAQRGIFRETNGLAVFGYRSRRLVVNTNSFDFSTAPKSWLELTNAVWRGKIALGYPQFGTTSTHFHALRQHWGEPAWKAWCQALAANQPRLVDGNSVVVKMVASGEAVIGMTDSDDIAAAQREGAPVAALPINEECLLIPNAAGLVAGGPNPNPAEVLFDYLQKPEVARELVAMNALEGASPAEVQVQTLKPDWDAMLRDLDSAVSVLNEIFLR